MDAGIAELKRWITEAERIVIFTGADVCNSYYCGDLGKFVTDGDTKADVVVIAGEGDAMRKSAVLRP